MASTPPPTTPIFSLEDGVSQECKDLMSSLPKEKGWISNHMYKYQGFWYESNLLPGVLACQSHFQAHDTDTLLVTSPKSGTTWLKALLFALLNRTRYPDSQTHPLLTNNSHDLVPTLEFMIDSHGQFPDITSSPSSSPRIFATHVPLVSLPNSVKDSACKIVYLCRNPKDNFISFWHFANKLRAEWGKTTNDASLEQGFDMFCEGQSSFGPFWDHALSYWKESLEKPLKVIFFKYEEMKEQPTFHLKRLAQCYKLVINLITYVESVMEKGACMLVYGTVTQFLGCPFSPEEEMKGVAEEIIKLCSFDNLSTLEVNKSGKSANGMKNNALFRRGEVGDWKNYLTDEMADRSDQIIREKLNGSGLKI